MSKQKHMKRPTSIGGMFGKIIKEASPFVQFIQQITEKDLQHINDSIPAGTTIDTMDQLKNMVNIISAKMTGFNPFKDAYQANFKLNPAGILNKWTLIDIGMIIYGEAGKHIKALPKHGYIGSIGKKSLPAAAIAGLLDTPTTKAPSGKVVQFNQIPTLGADQVSGSSISRPQTQGYSGVGYTMELGR